MTSFPIGLKLQRQLAYVRRSGRRNEKMPGMLSGYTFESYIEACSRCQNFSGSPELTVAMMKLVNKIIYAIHYNVPMDSKRFND